MQRSDRLIRLTKRLVDHPYLPLSLTDLSCELDAAKSSLSEDVAIIRQVLVEDGAGDIDSLQGALGGVRFRAALEPSQRRLFCEHIVERLCDTSRILPGGFLYMADILGDPDVLDKSGRIFSDAFHDAGVNVVVTVETKGIPLAVATARYLHVPVVVVRREHKVTEGPALSIHYVSGSERRIQTMSISTRAMPKNARVLIVDDFMRAGATAKAVMHLLAQFAANVVGTAIFMATAEPATKLIDHYTTLFSVGPVEEGKPPMVTSHETTRRENNESNAPDSSFDVNGISTGLHTL